MSKARRTRRDFCRCCKQQRPFAEGRRHFEITAFCKFLIACVVYGDFHRYVNRFPSTDKNRVVCAWPERCLMGRRKWNRNVINYINYLTHGFLREIFFNKTSDDIIDIPSDNCWRDISTSSMVIVFIYRSRKIQWKIHVAIFVWRHTWRA